MRLAADGKALLAKHQATLEKIERDIGVDRYSVLAIWGRETAYGTHKERHDAIRVLATLAYVGRRKDLFRHRAAGRSAHAAGRRAARQDALVVGRRHGADAVHADRIFHARSRSRR